jgi:hypothetical protein
VRICSAKNNENVEERFFNYSYDYYWVLFIIIISFIEPFKDVMKELGYVAEKRNPESKNNCIVNWLIFLLYPPLCCWRYNFHDTPISASMLLYK